MSEYDASAVKERYGRTPASVDQAMNYAKAVKIIAAADGHLPEEEKAAIRIGLGRMGAGEDVIQAIEAYDPKSETLEQVLGGFNKGGLRARMLLRDAVEIARADGHYAKEEKAAVAKSAEHLGVDPVTLKSIEALVEMEHAVRTLRKALFPKKK